MAVVVVNTILDGAATKIDPAWCEHSHLWCIKGCKVISQGLMLVFLHPFYCFIIFSMCQLLIFANVMHLSTLIWRGGGGGGQRLGFDKGRSPMVRTFNYHKVLGVRTFEFPPITDDILDWKL